MHPTILLVSILGGVFIIEVVLIFGGAASQHIGLSVCLPVCLSARLFQLASGEVSLTILTSTIAARKKEHRRATSPQTGY